MNDRRWEEIFWLIAVLPAIGIAMWLVLSRGEQNASQSLNERQDWWLAVATRTAYSDLRRTPRSLEPRPSHSTCLGTGSRKCFFSPCQCV